MSKIKGTRSSKVKKTRRNLAKKNIRANFLEEINALKKIIDLQTFKSALSIKLNNPIFQSSFYPTTSLFKDNFRRPIGASKESSLLKELYICIAKINKNSRFLNVLLGIRANFEHSILLGQVEKADKLLAEVLDISGLSYWYLENKLALLATKNDKDATNSFYKEITSKNLNPIEKRDFNLLFNKSQQNIPSDRNDFSLDALKDGLSLTSADYSTIDFLFRFNTSKIVNFEKVLRYFAPCNILDIYLTTTRILFTHHANDLINSEILDAIESIKGIEDPRWLNLKCIIHNDFIISSRENTFLTICDEYMKGDFNNVVKLCESAFEIWPEMATIYEFYVNALYNTELTPQLNPNGLLYQIVKLSLEFIASRGHRDISELNKKLYQYVSLDAVQFINLIKSKNQISTEKQNSEILYRYLDISSTSTNPFRMNSFDDGSFCFQLLNNENSKYVQSKLPPYRVFKRKADQLFANDDYEGAWLLYDKITSYPLHFKDELLVKKMICLLKSEKIEQAVNQLCEQYFAEDIDLRRFPCEYFLQEIENYPNALPNIIELTIAIYIFVKTTKGDMHTVALYFDDYMDNNSIEFPSDISPQSIKDRYLLEFVLNTDVLEGIHVCRQLYESPSHLMFDRVSILSSLLDTEDDKKKVEQFKNEISFLGHQYAKNFSLKDLSPGKIEVDRAILTSIATDQYAELFCNILDSLKSETSLPSLDEKGRFTGDEKITNRASFTFAYQLLLDIRDLYTLDGYYGLDYSLNTDIRHNGIVPVIRSVFEKHYLISNKVDGVHIDNPEFESRYKLVLKSHFYELMQQELREFSVDIDSKINNLKTRVIKIITDENEDKERVFNFIITEETVYKLLSLINAGSDYDAAIKWSFDHLEDLTEKSMKLGRTLISIGIYDDFSNKLMKLSQSLIRIGRGNEDFIERITLAKNDLQVTLNEVSEWLAFSNRKGEDFTLEYPIHEARIFVEKIFPRIKISTDINVGEEPVLYDGRGLKSFIKIFIMLIQNAAKYRHNETESVIFVYISYIEKNVVLNVSNKADSIDLKAIDTINSSINNFDITSEANKEKGSGLFKIKKILDIDLKVANKIKISSQKQDFMVSIQFSDDVLLAEKI
jgi:hypothetical protein